MSVDGVLDRWKNVPVRTRGLALIAAITVLLVGMAAHEQFRRATGHEIVLTAEPVDPRDLLRGAYVALDYKAARVDVASLTAAPDYTALRHTEQVYLVLHKTAALGWIVTRVLTAPPRDVAAGDVMLRAKFKPWTQLPAPGLDPPSTLVMDFGANRYFADEATAKALGATLRDKPFDVVLAVGGDGRPAIKGLIVDGVRRDEGFF